MIYTRPLVSPRSEEGYCAQTTYIKANESHKGTDISPAVVIEHVERKPKELIRALYSTEFTIGQSIRVHEISSSRRDERRHVLSTALSGRRVETNDFYRRASDTLASENLRDFSSNIN